MSDSPTSKSNTSAIKFDVQKARHLHQIGKAHQLHGPIDSKVLKAAVYGANDGIITTFSVVVGVAGAGLAPSIVLILGVANLLSDGLAMGIGDFLGERSEQKFKKYQYAIEQWEQANIPEQELTELKQYFAKHDVAEKDAEQLAQIIKNNPTLWTELGFIDEMGTESYSGHDTLWQTGVATLIAFISAGFLPLIPYVFHSLGFPYFQQQQFMLSVVATAGALFFIGSMRTIMTKGRWWQNGLEMLLIGAVAAIAAYIAGAAIKDLIH